MELLEGLKGIVDARQVEILLYLVLANILTGSVGALLHGNFQLIKMLNFWKRLGVLAVAYIIVSLVAVVMSDFTEFRIATWGIMIAFMLGHIMANLKEWGLPIPARLVKLFEG